MGNTNHIVTASKVTLNHKYTFMWTCPRCGVENTIQSDWDTIIDMCPGCENMYEVECE